MLKKWAFIIGFVTFGLFFGVVKADAAVTVEDFKSAVVEYGGKSYNYYVIWTGADAFGDDAYMMLASDTPIQRVYTKDGGIYVTGGNVRGFTQRLEDGSSVSGLGGTENASDRFIGRVSTVIQSTENVFEGVSGNTIFFLATPLWVLGDKVQTLEEIPVAMATTMVDGGIISTGLMVLAILLGVFLIPRLVYSFLR